MATSDPHPDLTTTERNRLLRTTTDARRLCWALNGPLSTSLRVMAEQFYNPDVLLEPYVRAGSQINDLYAGGFHPISQAPLTDSRIASATVSVDYLDRWEDEWVEMHSECWDGPEEDGQPDPESVRYGTVPGEEPEYEGFSGREHLLMCCGTDRPLNKAATLEVRAKGEFLTVHDFVSAVHPWLMGLREDILAAAGVLEKKPLPADSELMVYHPGPGSLMIVVGEEEWKRSMRKHLQHDRLAAMKPYQLFMPVGEGSGNVPVWGCTAAYADAA